MIRTLIVFAILMLSTSTAFSHGGRTNAFGCHRTEGIKKYHCHGDLSKLEKINAPYADLNHNGNPRVVDGDTIEMKIRLKGLDTPESNQNCKIDGACVPCGTFATGYLQNLIKGAVIECRGDKKDRYDRLIATCYIDGRNINRAMVLSGWAVIDPRFSQEYMPELEKAKAGKAGLWRGEFVTPWEWRKNRQDICR